MPPYVWYATLSWGYSDVLYPTPTGCLFSWLVSTTYQDDMALFWTVSHVMTSTEGTVGKQCHECPLYKQRRKKQKYWQPIPNLRLQQWSLPPIFLETTCICITFQILRGGLNGKERISISFNNRPCFFLTYPFPSCSPLWISNVIALIPIVLNLKQIECILLHVETVYVSRTFGW